MAFTVRWGIVSTVGGSILDMFLGAYAYVSTQGNMAHAFTKDILLERPDADIKHVLNGVSSTSLDRAKSFLSEFHSEGQAYGSVEDLARDPAINAIYIASPTSLHYRHALTCLRAHKAVLLEVFPRLSYALPPT